jgi:hypothetical protein
MDTHEVVIHHAESNRGCVVLDLLENAFVRRVKRRVCILIVRLERST